MAPLAEHLQAELGLGEPFRDPGVGEFGLENVVFAVGDCFLEVISPSREETAAGRHLRRAGGDCGYMAIFDVEDLEGARERAGELGVRTVWQIDLPDISGTHLHPGDMRGAIVSVDRSEPYGSWRWGGPEWTGRIAARMAGELSGITVAAPEPELAAERWGAVLGRAPQSGSCSLELDGARVSFLAAGEGAPRGIVAIDIGIPAAVRAGRASIDLGLVRIDLHDSAR
jgi:hypothetical protein